jgi:hypothetical protein
MKAYVMNYGRFERMVAAKTMSEAAGKLEVSMYHFGKFARATGNAQNIKVAMSAAGTVFERMIDSKEGWRPKE